jgi:AcrR family transcriptional regulator
MGAQEADYGQRRSTLQQARSRETRKSLVRSAVALWRVQGFQETTIEEICRAAGVSKGLFYFYFERKEDLLFEIGVLSSAAIARDAQRALDRDEQLEDVVRDVLTSLERSIRRNPRELVLTAILEGYRRTPDFDGPDAMPFVFTSLFRRAQQGGELPAGANTNRLAWMAQTLVSEGVRGWALGMLDRQSFVDEVAGQIGLVLGGARAARTT